MLHRQLVRAALGTGVVLGLLTSAGCQSGGDTDTSPTGAPGASGPTAPIAQPSPSDPTWELGPGETLFTSIADQKAGDTVIDTTGIGAYFAVYARCQGEDLVVEISYADDGPGETFVPVCDGLVNREQVYVDPDQPVEIVRVLVTGVGDWAVAVVQNLEIAESLGAGG